MSKCSKVLDKLFAYVNAKESALPCDIKGVRTYEAWCDRCDSKHQVSVTKENNNPYLMLELAHFENIVVPLIEAGLLKPSDVLPKKEGIS